jgi:tubulin-specific chaperone A
MPAPSPLSIATSSLQRLVKEETSYHKELQQQKDAIAKLEKLEGQGEAEGEEGNREFQLKQEVSDLDRLLLCYSTGRMSPSRSTVVPC